MSFILDQTIAHRATVGERDCYVDWIDALRSVNGNPWRAEARDFGQATVIACAGCPARIINRCFGMTPATVEYLPEILAFFDEHDADPSIDLNPYGDYGEQSDFFAKLSAHGLHQSGFHQLLIGRPDDRGEAVSSGEKASMTIQRVGREAESAYAMIHERVFGPGLLITVLLSHPNFHGFLAKEDGEPAALGVLHMRGKVASLANGITLPEFRGRGLQLALLRRRIQLARELGCDLIVSQSNPLNTSLRNQLRAGLSVAGTKAIWSRISVRQ